MTKSQSTTYVYAPKDLHDFVAELVLEKAVDSDLVRFEGPSSRDLDRDPTPEAKYILRICEGDSFAELRDRICRHVPHGARIVLIDQSKQHEMRITAFHCSFCVVLTSQASESEIESAVLGAIDGVAPSPKTVVAIMDDAKAAHVRRCCERLTASELEVLCLVLEGAMNKAIANRLDISERTVENRRRKIFEKFETHSVAVIARMISETIGCETVLQMRTSK